MEKTNREKLFEYAKSQIGFDVTPKDLVPDDVACAESFSTVVQKGIFPEMEIIPYTLTLYHFLKNSLNWKLTTDLKPGCAIISPTTLGNGIIPNGHVGIISENGKIMSNTSENGLWMENYTIEKWVERFRVKGGYPIFVFEPI